MILEGVLVSMHGKPLRAAVYARVSTEDQAEAKTIDNQVDFARRYCELHGVPVHDFYLDDGVSGTVPLENRPEGLRLLKDAEAGKFTLVLVYRLDRLARNTMHLLNAYDRLEKLGIGLRSMTEQFDTSTPTGKFVMTMFASIAALERDTIVERTSLGKERTARIGKWLGGKPPYGYRVTDDGYLEIDEKEAEVIRLIFRLYTEDRMGTVPIADYLNANNIPTAYQVKGVGVTTKGKWGAGRISRILNNTTYKGLHEYRKLTKSRKERIVREVPPIVTEEVWNKAQVLLRKNFVMARRNAKQEYLLKSLIKCGICDKSYVGDSGYYRCTGNSSFRGKSEPKCGARSIGAGLLEGIVWQDVKQFVEDPGPVIALLEQKAKEQIEKAKPVEVELAEIEKVLAAKQAERERVISLFRKGFISEAETQRELLALGKEMEALAQRKEILFDQQGRHEALKTKTINAQLLLEQLREKINESDVRAKRELVEALVDHIRIDTVDEGRKKLPKVTITYCFDSPAGNDPDYSAYSSMPKIPAVGSRLASR